MKKINRIDDLHQSILLLELKQANEAIILKDQFDETLASLKPINLIKNTFSEITSLPDLKDNIVNASVGLASGYISKKLLFGNTHNPFKEILGSLIQMGVTSIVSKNADSIKTFISNTASSLMHKKDEV